MSLLNGMRKVSDSAFELTSLCLAPLIFDIKQNKTFFLYLFIFLHKSEVCIQVIITVLGSILQHLSL